MAEMPKLARWSNPPAVLETVDHFAACVYWGNWRAVTVYRREHAGRVWVRLRTWNKHRKKHVWYPSKRFYVVPLEHAVELAGALCAAAGGITQDEPDWLIDFQAAAERRLMTLGVSGDALNAAVKRIEGA